VKDIGLLSFRIIDLQGNFQYSKADYISRRILDVTASLTIQCANYNKAAKY